MVEHVRAELATVDRERARVLAAVKSGERVGGLLEALQALTRRQMDLDAAHRDRSQERHFCQREPASTR